MLRSRWAAYKLRDRVVSMVFDIRMGMAAILACFIMISCASTTDRRARDEAAEWTSAIETGDIDALTGGSGLPFLFEGEILPTAAIVRDLWAGLGKSGYGFDPAGEVSLFDVDEQTWKTFSDSREVEIWFRRHAPKRASVARIPTTGGGIVLILNRHPGEEARLWGLRVETP